MSNESLKKSGVFLKEGRFVDKMINVIFDSNIFFGPVKKMASSKGGFGGITLEDFCRLRDDNGVVPYFTLPNFIEYLMGISSKNFETNIKEAQFFSKVTCGIRVLQSPLELVERECAILVAGTLVPFSKSSVDVIQKICLVMDRLAHAQKWEEVKSDVELSQAKINDFKSQQWDESYERIARDEFSQSKSVREQRTRNWQKYFVKMIKQLSIPEEIVALGAEFVFREVFSLRYRFSAFWGCASRKILNGEHISFQDYGDIDQGCYLSIADYWVTNDPGAKQNLTKAEEMGLLPKGEVTPRIVNWDDFITQLVRRELRAEIAPRKTRPIKFDMKSELLS